MCIFCFFDSGAHSSKKEKDGWEKKRTEREVKEVKRETEERKVRGTGAKTRRKQEESMREADGE